MKTDPNATVNPVIVDGHWEQSGLTKREFFAAMAMQGLAEVSNTEYVGASKSLESVATMAVRHADALIEALNDNHEGFSFEDHKREEAELEASEVRSAATEYRKAKNR